MPPITPPTIAPTGAAEGVEFEGELLVGVAGKVAAPVGEIVAAVLVIAELFVKIAPRAGLSHDVGYSALHRCQFRLGAR